MPAVEPPKSLRAVNPNVPCPTEDFVCTHSESFHENSRKAIVSIHVNKAFESPAKDAKVNHHRLKNFSKYVVENKYCISFTTLLTVYALLGDDFRLMLTQKPADDIFNWMVVICILVFTLECVLAVVGKAGYIWSFFFWLDIISTISLLLDITIIADELFASSSPNESSNASDMRSSRAAKIGAKAGRVVRVLRLVRILKLYKAVAEAKAREKRSKQLQAMPGEDDDDWADECDAESSKDSITKETQVGKKLSEMTTRKVICLILAMLLGLPLMQAEQSDQLAFSSSYGADQVWNKFKEFEKDRTSLKKDDYIQSMLHFIYYHNWFASEDPDKWCPMENCAGEYYSQVFWVGFTGQESQSDLVNKFAKISSMSGADIKDFEKKYSSTNGLYNLGYMPAEEAHTALTSDWTIQCATDGFSRVGFSLLDSESHNIAHRVKCPQHLRPQELMFVSPRRISISDMKASYMVFFFDLRPFVKTEALFNLINTLNILVLLVVMSLVFSNDANRLIVHPIERMIKNVEAIRDNPLMAMKMADEEFKAEEVAKAKKKRKKKEFLKSLISDLASCNLCASRTNHQPMETVILEKTIIKLGSLLALGFGEAGANIIGHNLKGGDSAGVNAMITGTRVECIIGVVRIRDFSTATEVLQSKIMTFVNQIAEVVHGVVNELAGAPNRNSGEYFLVIWRVMENAQVSEVSSKDVNAHACSNKSQSVVGRLAGMSIVAFAKILGGLHRSPILATYRGHPGLQYRLGANCRVNLSFGLHAGWAIEGAVGSEFKIDASYLSPNVSIATSVERATQTYGVSLMVAQSVAELCTQSVRAKCRLIDTVIITGSSFPIEIYCVDLDYTAISVDNAPPLKLVWNTRNRFKVRQFLEAEKVAMQSDSFKVSELFDSDSTIREMRRRYTIEFFQLFNMGYQNYSQGEWEVARRMLSCTRAILGTEDGPSSALLRHMEQYSFEAPREWQGVRELVCAIPGEHR